MSAQPLQYAIDWTAKRPPEVQAKIEKGMREAEEHADPFWKVVLSGCILAVARRRAELSVDDVLEELDAVNQERIRRGDPKVETHHLCAIGPAMQRAFKDGLISPTDRVVRSKIGHKNGNLHAVWKSNHYAPF